MRFEKLDENKIRITLDLKDLKDKDINYQDFMSNSMDTQKLFLDMLEQAEEEIGFRTKDYKIMIEAFATTEGYFILTVTRTLPDEEQFKKKNLKIKRKNILINKNEVIYAFECFEDFCAFCTFIDSSIINNIDKFSKDISLYLLNNTYYLIVNNINLNFKYLKLFYSRISEFGKFVNDSNLFKNKLLEYGKPIIKNKAIKTCIKYFCNNSKKATL